MIFDPSLKFVFVKTSKVAGSTIEQILGPELSANAIRTPADTRVGESRQYFRDPTPYRVCWLPAKQLRARVPHLLVDNPLEFTKFLVDRTFGRSPRYRYGSHKLCSPSDSHLSAWAVRRLIGDDQWFASLRVSAVRHPYDMLVSLYLHQGRKGNNSDIGTFEEWITGNPDLLISNWRILREYERRGDVSCYRDPHVSFLIRYESLERDIDTLCGMLGIEASRVLPRLRSIRVHDSGRPSPSSRCAELMGLLTPRAKAIIDCLCEAEMREFGYQPNFDLWS